VSAAQTWRKALTGAAWSSVASTGALVLSFVIFVLLARLLGPTEFGTIAIATIFLDATLVLARAGLSDAVVQREELDEAAADTAFWLSLGTAALSCAVLLAIAKPCALLFELPVLEPVLQALSVAPVIGALGSVHEARLVRGFGFKRLAVRTLAGNALGGGVAVAMALTGFGLWSLVAQRLVTAAALTVLCWFALPWRPRARFDRAAGSRMLLFGSKMLGSNLLLLLNGRVHEIVAALLLNPAAVGFLRVAWRCLDLLMQVAVSPLVSIALPTLSRLTGDPAQVREAFIRFVGGTALVAFPCFFGFAAVAPSLIPLAFGEQWAPAVGLSQILSLLVLPALPSAFAWPTLAALDRAGLALSVTALQVAVGAVLSVLAAPFGLVAMAVSHVLRAFVLWPISLAALTRAVALPQALVLASLLRPLAAATVMAAAVAALHPLLADRLGRLPGLAASIGLGVALYAGLIRLIAGDLCRDLIRLARGRAALEA
jgi:O-antigen/teichoic acid export membrane protein